jgi:uncharacterized protein
MYLFQVLSYLKKVHAMQTTLPVADALFGKTRQAVLGILFGNPGRAYYMREIVHAADCGASQVQRELEQLTRAGLITRLPRANQVYFQANEAASIYPELVALVAKTFALGDFLRMTLVPFATLIQSAFIFGTVARSEHHATSDVDVMIVGDVLLSDLDGALQEVEKKIARPVSVTVMDLKEYVRRRKARDHFLQTILREPKIFLIGNDRELAKLHERRTQ